MKYINNVIRFFRNTKNKMFETWEAWAAKPNHRVKARRMRATIAALIALGSYAKGQKDSGDATIIEEAVTSINKVIDDVEGLFDQSVKIEYTVVANDSLTLIAERYGVTVDDILEANPQITDPNLIKVGDVIIISNPVTIPEVKSGPNDLDNNTQETMPQINVGADLPAGYERGIDFSATVGKINWDELGASYERGEFSYIIGIQHLIVMLLEHYKYQNFMFWYLLPIN